MHTACSVLRAHLCGVQERVAFIICFLGSAASSSPLSSTHAHAHAQDEREKTKKKKKKKNNLRT
jgi:hypothetical protein